MPANGLWVSRSAALASQEMFNDGLIRNDAFLSTTWRLALRLATSVGMAPEMLRQVTTIPKENLPWVPMPLLRPCQSL